MEHLTSDALLQFWSALGALLATLLLTAGTLWASAQVTTQARQLWGAVRGYTPQVRAEVDEPGDAINTELAQLTTVPAAVWAALLPAFVDALAAGLERALDEAASGDPPAA